MQLGGMTKRHLRVTKGKLIAPALRMLQGENSESSYAKIANATEMQLTDMYGNDIRTWISNMSS